MGLNGRMPALTVRAVDHGLWTPTWTVRDLRDRTGEITQWGQDGASMKEILHGFPRSLYLDQWAPGNCLLNEGINELWALVCGTGATKFDNSNANIGAGDSDTGEAATQTGLQAVSNKLYKAMDAGYPTYGTSQKATWRSTFGTTEANWPWEEVTVANGNSDAAKNLNRKVQSFGTKSALYARIATAEIALS